MFYPNTTDMPRLVRAYLAFSHHNLLAAAMQGCRSATPANFGGLPHLETRALFNKNISSN